MTRSAAALVIGALAAAGILACGSASAADYSDPIGDSKNVPDISAINLANDLDGLISFSIQIANRQSRLFCEDRITVGFDADRDVRTGAGRGIDYLLSLQGCRPVRLSYVDSGHPNGIVIPSATVQGSFSAGTAAMTIHRRDLGDPSAFDFLVVTNLVYSTGVSSVQDLAPDGGGSFRYFLAIGPSPPPPPNSILLGRPAAKAPGIRAGARFGIATPVGTDADSVTVSCSIRIGARALRSAGRYVDGYAVCLGAAPVSSAGQRLTGLVKASVYGASAVKAFSFVVGHG